MDSLDAITLLYLSKHWDGRGTLLDCAHKFQQTRSELVNALQNEKDEAFHKPLESGNFTF